MFRTRTIAAAVTLCGVALFLSRGGENMVLLVANPPPIECVRVLSGNASVYRHLAVAELFRVGFNKVSIQVEQLDPVSHKRGCHNSHIRAHTWAVQHNCQTVLVVEDDVVFATNISQAWQSLTSYMALSSEWDAIFLGYTAIKIQRSAYPGVVRLTKPMLTHAVVFPLRTSRRIVEMPPWQRQPTNLSITEAFDVRLWYSGVVSKAYALYPAVAGQRGAQSHSYSRDKNALLDWAKSLSGLGWVNWMSYEQCARYYKLAGTASQWLGGLIDGADDWQSTARVFTCDT